MQKWRSDSVQFYQRWDARLQIGRRPIGRAADRYQNTFDAEFAGGLAWWIMSSNKIVLSLIIVLVDVNTLSTFGMKNPGAGKQERE